MRQVVQFLALIVFAYQSCLALLKYIDSPTIEHISKITSRNDKSFNPRKKELHVLSLKITNLDNISLIFRIDLFRTIEIIVRVFHSIDLNINNANLCIF